MEKLNQSGRDLADYLKRLSYHFKKTTEDRAEAQKVNIVGAGGAITAAYEQIRNAAENVDEHLLLQNAIQRFYKRVFMTRDAKLANDSGSELAIELTFAGYIENDTLTEAQVTQVTTLARKTYQAYEQVIDRRLEHFNVVSKWFVSVLSVEVENVLTDHMTDMVFVDFAYRQMDAVAGDTPELSVEDRASLLYVAIHEALLKSNNAVVRAMLLRRYNADISNIDQYLELNSKIDVLIDSKAADKLYRIVSKQGAPLRVLRRMMETKPDLARLLEHHDEFLEAYEKQVNQEYDLVGQKLNRAIIRSIIFLIITKFIVGIAAEVPYDLWIHGSIIWEALIINLIFPPLYMYLLRLTLKLPGYPNTVALVNRIESMLYGDREVLTKADRQRRYGPIFSTIYMVISLAVFVGVIYLLLLLKFSFVHIIIFFVFVSAASFLGFRLSRNIRELELVKSSSGGVTFIRDMLYLPFVIVGRWISEKYSRVNIVATVLDMFIELPMKTLLRMVRQWGAFLDDRKDNI